MNRSPSKSSLSVFDSDRKVRQVPIEVGQEFRVRPARGGNSVYLRVDGPDGCAFQAALKTGRGRSEPIWFEIDPFDQWSLQTQDVAYDRFPNNYEPVVQPPRFFPDSSPLDVLVLFDGTLCADRMIEDEDGTHWLTQSFFANETLVQSLGEIVGSVLSALDRGETRFSVLAFGDDQSTRGIVDASPAYHLVPVLGDRAFAPFDITEVSSVLANVAQTSGADCVDAVADALAAATSWNWREDARKLVLLIGDSPGFSVLEPPPTALQQINAMRRSVDLEGALDSLHQRSIMIASIFVARAIDPGAEDERQNLTRLLNQYCSNQYRAAATLDSFSVRASIAEDRINCDLQSLIAALQEHPSRVARGLSYACLDDPQG